MQSNHQPIIQIKNISKEFVRGVKSPDNALERILSFFSSRKPKNVFSVINKLDLQINSGEIIGLVGRNGSGKSVLLKIMADIYQPDSGQIITNGKVVYLGGFGYGLKDKLTMRENIYLAGILMGLSRSEIKEKFLKIVSFSELEEFVDAKVFQFSSGMMSRLRFSITINFLEKTGVNLLLLDEVFGAGGDLAFEKKAILKMEELIKSGVAVVLVSHNLGLVKRYCQRAILIEKGQIIKTGLSEEIVSFYENMINSNDKK